MAVPLPPKRLRCFIGPFFLLLGILLYLNSFSGPFVLDDVRNIEDNPHIRIDSLDPKSLVQAAFKSPCSNRPLANVSLALNYYFHGSDPVGYHVVNVAIHIITGFFLYLLLRLTLQLALAGPVFSTLFLNQASGRHSQAGFRFNATIESDDSASMGPAWAGLFASLLWFVHPVQTGAVAYIVQRMTGMASMFYILSLFLYARARVTRNRQWRWVMFGGCGLAGLMGLASKEIAVTLPLFIFLYEWFFFQNLTRTWLRKQLVPLGIVIGLLGILALFYLGPKPYERILTGYEMRDFTLPERLLTECRVVLRYLSLLVYPHPSRLNLDYDFSLSRSLLRPSSTFLAIAFLGGLFVLACCCARRHRLFSFAVLWFLGNLIIESSVIGLEIIFEHRIYLPSMFLGLIPVLFFHRYLKSQFRFVATCSVLVLILCVWTYQRTATWGNARLLWADCVKKSPGKARPQVNLGVILYKSGNTDRAVSHFRRALEINANYAPAHNSYGAVLLKQGKLTEAVEHFSRALAIDPDYADARENLMIVLGRLNPPAGEAEKLNQEAVMLIAKGRLSAAERKLAKALRLQPEFPEAHYNLANILVAQRHEGRAVSHFTEAIRIRPDYAEAHNNLGIVLAKQGKTDLAIHHFSAALRAKPGFSEARKNLERARKQ